MDFSEHLKKITDPLNYKIGMAKFTSVSSRILKEPSRTHTILKDEFFLEMKNKAIAEIMEENKEIWGKMSSEDKEDLIEEREKELWLKVKNGGILAFSLIFGISL